MKVVILSAPRAYTKSIQKFVASALPNSQAKAFDHLGRTAGHLGEALHFTEASSLGWCGVDKVWKNARPPVGKTLEFYQPELSSANLIYTKTAKRTKLSCAEARAFVEQLLTLDDWVLKVFPNKFYEYWSWTEDEITRFIEFIAERVDLVIPVIRLDLKAQADSVSSAALFGWSLADRLPEATRSQASVNEMTATGNRELRVRRLCSKLGLLPTWSESWSTNGEQILKRYGLKANIPFPQEIEYSNLPTPTNKFYKCGCDSSPQILRYRVNQAYPEYKEFVKELARLKVEAIGYVGTEADKDIWISLEDFNNFVASTEAIRTSMRKYEKAYHESIGV